jgi:hypothetical protein
MALADQFRRLEPTLNDDDDDNNNNNNNNVCDLEKDAIIYRK